MVISVMSKPTAHFEIMSDTEYPIWMATTAFDPVIPIIGNTYTTGYLKRENEIIFKTH